MVTLPFCARATLVLFGLILVVYSLHAAQLLLVPLCWSIFLALLLAPATHWLEQHHFSRGWAITLIMFVATVIVSAVFYLISAQMVSLVSDLPSIAEPLEQGYQKVRSAVETYLEIPYEQQPAQLIKTLSAYLERGVSTLGSTLTATAKTVTMLAVMPVYIFFLLYYQDNYQEFVRRLYRHRDSDQALDVVRKASSVVQGYLAGLLTVTLLVGIMAFFVFFGLGVKYALVFAIFVAVFNLIPYVGVFIASTVSILYVFLTTDSLLYPFLTFLLLWGIQLLENNIITPYIVGQRIKLNPLVVILAVFSGASLWGVSGMILFIPLVGALKVLFDEVEAWEAYGYLLGAKR